MSAMTLEAAVRWLVENEVQARRDRNGTVVFDRVPQGVTVPGGVTIALKEYPGDFPVITPNGAKSTGRDERHIARQRDETVKQQVAARQSDTEQPDVTYLPMREPFPRPLADAAFHGLIGAIVTAYHGLTEAAPAAMLVQGLVAYGNAVGRRPHVMIGETRHGTNEFTAIIGRSAHARKGTAWDNIYGIFHAAAPQWAGECLIHGLGSGEGLIAPLADRPDDATDSFTEKRALVQESEFAAILAVQGREGSRLSPILRDAWDGKTLRNTVRHNPQKATGAHVSVIAHITREELQTTLSESDRRNGYGNRFLWVASDREGLVPRPKPLPTTVKNGLVTRLHDAITSGSTTDAVDFDADAAAYWQDEVYAALSVDRPGLVGFLTARAEAHVVRLALLYCLLDGEVAIRRVHLDAALAVWVYCLASARWAFGDRLGNRTAEAIVRFLRSRSEGASRTDIRYHFGRNKSSSELSDALGLLIDNGLVTYEMRRPEGGIGAPIEWWLTDV